jgi:hypothetical protein
MASNSRSKNNKLKERKLIIIRRILEINNNK